MLLVLDSGLFFFELLLFAEETGILFKFKSAADGLDMVLANFVEGSVEGVELEVVCVLAGRVEREEEHGGLGAAIEWRMDGFVGRGHQVRLVGRLVVQLLVLSKRVLEHILFFSQNLIEMTHFSMVI